MTTLVATGQITIVDVLDGKSDSFVAFKTWEFQNTFDGWTSTGFTSTLGVDSLTLESITTSSAIFKSVTITGAIYTKIRARIRRISGTNPWEGSFYYTTSGHGSSNDYRAIAPAASDLSKWHIVEWDLSNNQDWLSNTILAIRIDLISQIGDVWEIDWISVGKSGSGTYGSDWADVSGNGKPADGAEVNSPSIGVKANYNSFNTVNAGEMYIHGFTGDGIAADIDGWISSNGSRISVPKGQVFTGSIGKGYIVFDTLKRDQLILAGFPVSVAFAVKEADGTWTYDNNTPTRVAFTPDASYVAIGNCVTDAADNIYSATVWPSGQSLDVVAEAGATVGANWQTNVSNIPYASIYSNDDSVALGFNPTFSAWSGAYPDGYSKVGTSTITKDTIIKRVGEQSVKFVIPADASGNRYLRAVANFSTSPMPLGTFVSGTIDLYIAEFVSGGKPGLLFRLYTNAALSAYSDYHIAADTAIVGGWQRLLFTARVPAGQQIYGIAAYLMASSAYSQMGGANFIGTVNYDNFRFAFFDSSIDNKTITVAPDGTLSGGGGGQVTITGLGYTGDLAATKNVNRGPWAIGQDYAVGDFVTKDGSSWSCITAHNSGAPNQPPTLPTIENSYWKLLSAMGNSSVSVAVSNSAHTFPAGSTGAVSSYANSGTTIKVSEGATELVYDAVGTANGTWKVTTSATNITVGTLTDSGNYLTVGNHSGVASGTDQSIIIYTIIGKTSQGVSFTIPIQQSFGKSKTGSTGTAGTNGTNGVRGSQHFYLSGHTTWSDSAAATAIAANGGPITNDIVTEYGTGYSQTKLWTGSAWSAVAVAIDGSLLVSGSVVSAALAAKSVTADKINGTNLEVINGTFSGELAAATGTFSGELSAATGTFAGSLMAGVIDLTSAVGVTYTYPTPGTYSLTVPTDKTSMRITAVAGGGGGGSTAQSEYCGGGGGGGRGAVVVGTFNNLTPGTSLSLVVGTGGTGGSGSSAGGTGGSTTVTGYVSASGGGGGGGAPGYGNFNGGTGGSPGGISGQNAATGYSCAAGGKGGSTVYGSGGSGGGGGINYLYGSNGLAGGTGAGGGGGSGSGYAGGNGGNGKLIIEFFNPNSVILQTTFAALVAKYNALCSSVSHTEHQYTL